MVTNALPLAKRLFSGGFHVGDATEQESTVHVSAVKMSNRDLISDGLRVEPGKRNNRRDSLKRNKKSDTDNDTGVESDSGSDPGIENTSPFSRTFSASATRGDYFPAAEKSTALLISLHSRNAEDDELLKYLEAIEQKAFEVKGLIEKAKLDTVLNIRRQIEAEFNGLSLEEIPAKCHQKIDRAIQRYLQRELENIKAEYEQRGSGDRLESDAEATGRSMTTERDEDLERENRDLKEKVESLETSVTRVDMLYIMQKKENEYLTEKVSKLERQMANEKLRYESELDNVRNDFDEDRTDKRFSKCSMNEKGKERGKGSSKEFALLCRKLEQEEKRNEALRVAGEADQTTIHCLEQKVTDMENQLKNSRAEVSDLLGEIREFQEKEKQQEEKFRVCELQLKEVMDERRLLRETLIMSEHEISLLENKLGNENNVAWKESKREILEELRKLEKHIKVIHKEKRKLENKYLAFKIENENLSDSLSSFSRTKDILTPLGSCDVSRRESALSSHSSSLSSSIAGSDIEDDTSNDGCLGNKNKSSYPSGRRRRRSNQDHKDKQFAEAVAKKLLFAQKTMKDQNCNFSSFQNSGEDLLNEADELVKRVDSLHAEKRAIKMELESIRSAQTENVKC